jgi:hypothetical protein
LAGVALLLGLAGLAVWQRSSSERILASPEPTTAALQPAPRWELAVHCDRPLPPGNVRWVAAAGSAAVGASWPVTRLCEAEVSLDRGVELLAALRDADWPMRAVLEPQHPFYSVELTLMLDQLKIQLNQAPTARITLELMGAPCSDIESVFVREAGASGQVLGAAARVSVDANPCARQVELPFEDYGKSIGFRLEPAGYSASDTVFYGDRIAVTVQAITTRAAPPSRVVKARRPHPAVKDCLPPKEFCRK